MCDLNSNKNLDNLNESSKKINITLPSHGEENKNVEILSKEHLSSNVIEKDMDIEENDELNAKKSSESEYNILNDKRDGNTKKSTMNNLNENKDEKKSLTSSDVQIEYIYSPENEEKNCTDVYEIND